jgi:MarR family transcriptional regulator for hemolysin
MSSSTSSAGGRNLPIETLILVTGRALRRAYDARLGLLGLSMSEGALLRAIHEDGVLTQRELADHLFIGRAGAGQVIDRVEGRGLVERVADPVDRRVWRIALTKAGLALVTASEHVYADIREELRAGLSPAERTQLERALRMVQASAERLAEDVGAESGSSVA